MKPTVLLYNFNEAKRIKEVTVALMLLGFKIKKVEREDYNNPIGYVLGLEDIKPAEAPYEGEELDGEMLIMAGMNNKQIDSLLLSFKKRGIQKVKCKAVLTETNKHWDAISLYKELRREHEELNNIKPKA